ncbi:TIGR02466 family protein [Sphingomonas qomolangmaensis]|uniref:TIGR02466 family protein n=1 Tax=Sphingomonas qomolangmaensis TaxID=2918765 RepID=A0ABY5L9K0_9SPHN|nr:TIGR02466 family protein [Sphingomonas qomolangmaensis]UUL81406.1 TIGR02466 family protein [Sphingomonas qomolangmaensis]
MPIRSLFPTQFYEGRVDDAALIAELETSVRMLAKEDRAGIGWSREHGYRGYTSYASLNDLPQRDPAFGDLVRHLNRHVAAFAKACAFDLAGKRLKLDSLWVNVLQPGGTHSGHIHPHSVVSGTVYVAVPPGSGALKLEDPRLPMMMAAPARPDSFVYAEPEMGSVFLWESWLRHEVMPNAGTQDRISVSFNYRM